MCLTLLPLAWSFTDYVTLSPSAVRANSSPRRIYSWTILHSQVWNTRSINTPLKSRWSPANREFSVPMSLVMTWWWRWFSKMTENKVSESWSSLRLKTANVPTEHCETAYNEGYLVFIYHDVPGHFSSWWNCYVLGWVGELLFDFANSHVTSHSWSLHLLLQFQEVIGSNCDQSIQAELHIGPNQPYQVMEECLTDHTKLG